MEFQALIPAENGGFDPITREMTGKQAADEFAFGERARKTIDFHEDIILLEAGFFGGGVFAVLADVFDEKGHSIFWKAAGVALVWREFLEEKAAEGHGAHGPGADAAGDIRAGAPAFRELEGEHLLSGAALDAGGESA